jgi:hypothetical protein
MSTRTLDIRKIEHIQLTEADLAAEQEAKRLGGYSKLTDEHFRELVSRGINLIEGPIKAPEVAV